MIDLLLSIASSTIILLIFKIIEKQKVPIFPPIVINYITAASLGFVLNRSNPIVIFSEVPVWIYFSIIIGILLIVNFFFIGNATQKSGIAITTVSAKMSFVLPVLYSLLFDVNDVFTLAKAILLLLAMVSVFLVVLPNKYSLKGKMTIVYPILIFFGLGLLDSLIKYCQYNYISNPESSSIFSGVNFSIAGIIGLVVLLFSKKSRKTILNIKVLILGVALGAANFGSMYFIINALNALKYDNSMVFGINNIGVVVLSVLMAVLVFKEKYSKINWIGLIISVIVLIGMIRIFV
ncbi:MAG: hypothetical protein JEZ09_10795 [Salinivirgaceae bacterium]|nr:hypothetical protein [Salinivirgaceae bacterium]